MQNINHQLVGDIIEKIIDIKKINQKQFAELTGINTSTLNSIVNGNKSPNLITIQKMCNSLDMSLSEFFSLGEPILKTDPQNVKDKKKEQVLKLFLSGLSDEKLEELNQQPIEKLQEFFKFVNQFIDIILGK